jgi:hypothetical protein
MTAGAGALDLAAYLRRIGLQAHVMEVLDRLPPA